MSEFSRNQEAEERRKLLDIIKQEEDELDDLILPSWFHNDNESDTHGEENKSYDDNESSFTFVNDTASNEKESSFLEKEKNDNSDIDENLTANTKSQQLRNRINSIKKKARDLKQHENDDQAAENQEIRNYVRERGKKQMDEVDPEKWIKQEKARERVRSNRDKLLSTLTTEQLAERRKEQSDRVRKARNRMRESLSAEELEALKEKAKEKMQVRREKMKNDPERLEKLRERARNHARNKRKRLLEQSTPEEVERLKKKNSDQMRISRQRKLQQMSPEELAALRRRQADRVREARIQKMQKMSPDELKQLRRKQADKVNQARWIRQQKLKSGDTQEILRVVGRDIENACSKFIPYRADEALLSSFSILCLNDSIRVQESNERIARLERIIENGDDEEAVPDGPSLFDGGYTYFESIKCGFLNTNQLLKSEIKVEVDSI